MADIACPCFIVVGEHDELTTACAMRMHHVLPDSRIQVFRNASHSTCFEAPGPYFEALSTFLET